MNMHREITAHAHKHQKNLLIAIYERQSELYLEVPVLPLISSYWENKLYKKKKVTVHPIFPLQCNVW